MQTQAQSSVIEQATQLARSWQVRANELLTSEEEKIQQQMTRLLTNPADKILLTKIIDQSFRPHNPERVADQIDTLLEEYGVPHFFGDVEKLLIQMFVGFGKHFPAFAVPKMIEQMRGSSSRAIISHELRSLWKDALNCSSISANSRSAITITATVTWANAENLTKLYCPVYSNEWAGHKTPLNSSRAQ